MIHRKPTCSPDSRLQESVLWGKTLPNKLMNAVAAEFQPEK
jgi:hypothetical protein